MRPSPRMAVLVFCLILLGGCERAHRYPPAPPTSSTVSPETANTKLPPVPPQYGWLESEPRIEIPIHFVAEDTNPKEWQALKDFWTGWPAPVVLASPLEAAVALRWQLQLETIKIKVPRGLPDPTPSIPAANPPTLGKWLLGKRLFFDDKLLSLTLTTSTSCASCHI